jgi:LmbE family N-acetylglucosaminyl deacetylase
MVDTLVAVAHPDDETVYFGAWLAAGLAPHADVLVVTTGDHAGRGAERQESLRLACEDLGVRGVMQWDFLDHPGFLLPMKPLVARLSALQDARGYAQVLTHAPHGEYGHLNHVDVSLAVHRAFHGRAEVWVGADRLYPDAEVQLTPAQFALRARVLLERYPREVREAFRDLSFRRTEGACRLGLDEVEAIHALCTEGELPAPERLVAYRHLAPALRSFIRVPGAF